MGSATRCVPALGFRRYCTEWLGICVIFPGLFREASIGTQSSGTKLLWGNLAQKLLLNAFITKKKFAAKDNNRLRSYRGNYMKKVGVNNGRVSERKKLRKYDELRGKTSRRQATLKNGSSVEEGSRFQRKSPERKRPRGFSSRKKAPNMHMNIHLVGAGLPRIIGPAGAGSDISGFLGPDFSSQLRVLPNGQPPERDLHRQIEMLHMVTNANLAKVRCATPRRNAASAKPLKLGDELTSPGSPRSPGHIYVFDAIEQSPRYLLQDGSVNSPRKLPGSHTYTPFQNSESFEELSGLEDNFISSSEESIPAKLLTVRCWHKRYHMRSNSPKSCDASYNSCACIMEKDSLAAHANGARVHITFLQPILRAMLAGYDYTTCCINCLSSFKALGYQTYSGLQKFCLLYCLGTNEQMQSPEVVLDDLTLHSEAY
eukprot:Gb_28873 [translate_table: standard]